MPPAAHGPAPGLPDDEFTLRMRRVQSLVDAALEQPVDQRVDFVKRVAGDDAGLRREALEMLDLDRVEPLAASATDDLRLPNAPRPGSDLPSVERWKILREIGSGGMGAVYLAVRDDGQFKMRAAVKVIKRGMDTDEVLLRFDRERQVLASLDHPGIARLLDGGVTSDGRPYLVLEYVDGEPIDRWCDAQGLSVRERLELFCEVCEAVDDAHRSLVVHRDIKPSNVLVDSQGRPRLLDFGIAKVLDPAKEGQTLEVTATPLRLMTPAYASPEQVSGAPITTASDVYSLGALLFVLLTGRPPFVFETGSAAEVERLIRESDPTRCSQAVGEDPDPTTAKKRGTTPRALARALGGDIDTVVAKALRKEPRRRYGSASELAEDVRRYLDGLPVSARPDTFSYRARKFVRRNRVGVASAAAVLIALVAGLAVSLWQYREAREASERLADEVAIGEKRNAELETLNAELERQRADAQTNRQLAETRADELERLAGDLREETAAAEAAREDALAAEADAKEQRQLAESRAADVRTFATTMIYDMHRVLVPIEGAFQARATLVELGLPYLDRLREENLDDSALTRTVIGGYLRLAEIQASDFADSRGDVTSSLATIEKALDMALDLQEREPEDLGNDFQLGAALLGYGDTLTLAGRGGEAEAHFLHAAEVCGLDEGRPSSSVGRDTILADALVRLGSCARDSGDLDGAREFLDQAFTVYEDVGRRDRRHRTAAPRVLIELARIEEAAREYDAALELRMQGEDLLQQILDATPRDATVRRMLYSEQIVRGGLLCDLEMFEEALELGRELTERFGAEMRAAPDNPQPQRFYLSSLDVVARAAGDLEDWDEAYAASDDAIDAAVRASNRFPDSGFALHDLARMYLRRGLVERARGRLLDADDALRQSCAAFQSYVDRDPTSPFGLRSLQNARHNLTVVALQLAHRDGLDDEERAQWLRRAKQLLTETIGTIDQLAAVSAALPQDAEAERFARDELAKCERKLAEIGEGD